MVYRISDNMDDSIHHIPTIHDITTRRPATEDNNSVSIRIDNKLNRIRSIRKRKEREKTEIKT